MPRSRTFIFAAMVVLSFIVSLVIHRQAEAQLEEQQHTMAQNRKEIERLRLENKNLAEQVSYNAKLKDPISVAKETERLRNEITSLNQSINELKTQRTTNRLAQTTPSPVTNSSKESASYETMKLEMERVQPKAKDARNLAAAFQFYAYDHDGQFPKSIEDVVPYVAKLEGGERIEGHLTLDDIDILYSGNQKDLLEPGAVLLFRERQAWQTVDGKWARLYGIAAGASLFHAQEGTSFESWERKRLPALFGEKVDEGEQGRDSAKK